MNLTQLARPRWQDYFDAVSKAAGVQFTTVELAGLEFGSQLAADRSPLIGLSYEPDDDTLTLYLEGLEHRVLHPRAIHVEQELDEVHGIHAIDGAGVHHIIKFSAALALPPP